MVIPAQIWDDEYDIGDIPDEDLVALWTSGSLNELWEGRLVQEEMTYPIHGAVASRIGRALDAYLIQHQIATETYQHTLFNVTRSGQRRTILAPDVALMPVGATYPPRTIPTFAPWLAIEILSPKQSLPQMRIKCQTYLQAGTAEVWIVEPEEVFVEVITANGTITYTAQQALTSSILLGFAPIVQSLIP
jgi:Uma2 family endonuclease